MDTARIDSRYTKTIRNVYKNAEIHVEINDNFRKYQKKSEARQGKAISPKLFMLGRKAVFKKLLICISL